MNYEENQQFDQYLSDWYIFYSEMYSGPYSNYRFNVGIKAIFSHILEKRRELKKYQDLFSFYQVTKSSDKWLIGSIVFNNIYGFKNLPKLSNSHIENYRSDLQHMMHITQMSVNIMDYLLNKYDYVYIDHWRNKEKIMKYVNESYQLEQISLSKFKSAKNTLDLLEGYDSMSKLAYNGLMITNYIKFMNEDCLKQSEYTNPLHILNISHEFFELTRYERREMDRWNEDYDEEEDYEEYYEEDNDEYY